MKILPWPFHEILENPVITNKFSMADSARTCYQSESSGPDSDSALIRKCFVKEHHSVLEHGKVKIRFICDRGVSHELVRHRLISPSQESTRYCNYSKGRFGNEITVIKPIRILEDTIEYDIWESSCKTSEERYFDLLTAGVAAETARSVLPHSLKTTVDVSANLREWYHILKLRTAPDAQPDMRYMMHGVLLDLTTDYPEIFADLFKERNRRFIDDFVHSTKEKGSLND